MTWVLLVLQVWVLWWLWDTRRVLRLRSLRTRVPKMAPKLWKRRDWFRGAVPPNRFVVVRWPEGLLLYQGCQGAKAREMYDAHHPAEGQEIELWELGECRGHK